MKTSKSYKQQAARVVVKHKKIQSQISKADKNKNTKETRKVMQAGARKYPEPPLAKNHLTKPGVEEKLSLKPMYDAPYYKGSGKLQDMVAIITGGDSGIGRAVAVFFAREGADVSLIYLNEHNDAKETKQMVEKEGKQCLL